MIVKQPKSKSNNYLSKSTTHSQLTMGFEADETAANLNILLKEYFKTNNTDEKHLKKEQIEEQVREHIKNCAGHTPEIIAKVDAIDFDNKPFFLWHLYFADVFENGGFDIVIGNPPYIEAKKLKSISLQLKKKFKTYTGTADLSIYFIEQGLYLNKKNGYLTFITTNKFFNTGYGKPVRSIILENKIQQIINFEQVEVFEGILVSSVILGVTKIRTIEKAKFKYNKFYKLKAKEFKIQFAEKIEDTNFYNQTDLGDREWSFADATHLSIKEKIEAEGRILTPENDKVYIYRGITTGYNPAFIITDIQKDELIQKDVNNKSIIKNLLQGRNIRKWVYNESIENLIFTKQGVDISKYPSIESHLNNFFTNLNPREELEQKDEGKTVSGRKPGTYKWYEIQDNTAYYKEFEKQEKIIWGLTADKWAFAYDDEQHYLPSNGYLLTSDIISIKYILGLLNSNIMKYYFGFVGVMTAGGAYTLKHSTIQKLPLKIAKSTASIQVLVDKIITSKKENPQLAITTFERQIDELVFKLYDLTYEEVKVVCPDFWLSEVEYNAIEL